MQQLIEWQLSKHNAQNPLLQASFVLLDEQFEDWTKTFCQQFQLICKERSEGADRAQLHFQYGQCDYVLCYEALCESIWIEGCNVYAKQKIVQLNRHLMQDTLVENEHM